MACLRAPANVFKGQSSKRAENCFSEMKGLRVLGTLGALILAAGDDSIRFHSTHQFNQVLIA